jgi:hypothetical protein
MCSALGGVVLSVSSRTSIKHTVNMAAFVTEDDHEGRRGHLFSAGAGVTAFFADHVFHSVNRATGTPRLSRTLDFGAIFEAKAFSQIFAAV